MDGSRWAWIGIAAALSGCSPSGPPCGPGECGTRDLHTDAGPPEEGDAGPPPPRADAGPSAAGEPVDDGEPFACGAESHLLTETQISFAVPPNVRFMHVKAWGAGGNGEGRCDLGGNDGGIGGFTEAVFEVAPGTPLAIIVGQRGRAGVAGEDPARFGFGAWGGGGLSGVFRGNEPIGEGDRERALIVAGGGGSAQGNADCGPGGTGNHPDAGGADSMHGGFGSNEVTGGGGGYRGGAGGGRAAPAAGGTGFVAPEAVDSRTLHVERGAGAPPATDDPDYDGRAGRTESPGLVVIHYLCERPPPLI